MHTLHDKTDVELVRCEITYRFGANIRISISLKTLGNHGYRFFYVELSIGYDIKLGKTVTKQKMLPFRWIHPFLW